MAEEGPHFMNLKIFSDPDLSWDRVVEILISRLNPKHAFIPFSETIIY